MAGMIELITGGSVTSAKGYVAGATYAGIKTAGEDILDLGILKSEVPAAVAGMFSTSKILSPSVTLTKDRSSGGTAQAVVVNSGCANCSVGAQGLSDAAPTAPWGRRASATLSASLAAEQADLEPESVLVGSTGMIGVELPVALIRHHMSDVRLHDNGGGEFARAIMTTDSRPKEMAITADLDGHRVTLGGAAKGVGMIHPNMATMLAFIATDAAVETSFLQQATKEAVDASFNMIDVDGDTSTNDTVLVFANGAAGGPEVRGGTDAADAFQEALTYICTDLAKDLVRDGEGAQRLIEVTVDGAVSLSDARAAAREVASSLLVKAMVHGRDPNWGRVMMALGKSGIELDESSIDLFINDIHIVHEGVAFPYLKGAVINAMSVPEVNLRISLNIGDATAMAWGCDLTEEYVIFNSAYST